MKKTTFWIALIAVIVAAAAGVLIWQHHQKKEAVIAEIYVRGECVRTIDLSEVSEPERFDVEGEIGKNTVLVEPGRICITDADCPDHVCVHMGWLSAEHSFPIVCLPNKVVIQLADGADNPNQIDGVTG
jgi:hypothetical protein